MRQYITYVYLGYLWLHLVFYIYVGEISGTKIILVNNLTQGVFVSGLTKPNDAVSTEFELECYCIQ